MTSSTECPLFPKPRKGKGQPQKDNKKRNETTQASAAIITPGLSFAQAVQGKKPQQRAARGNDSSASNNDNSNNFQGINLEALNASTGQEGEFSFLHAIFEMKAIFNFFPNLISEMKKSSQCTDPTDKLHCLLKETHLKPEHSFSIPNYICYRNDRTNSVHGWGGTAILIKINISHFHVHTPPLLTGVEATLVALTPTDQEPFLVASIYAPPNPNYRNLSADLDTLFKNFNTAIVAGDYNAKHTSWGCVSSDPRGNYLLRYITNNKLDLIAPPTPTRNGFDSATTLDYALIKNLNWPCTAESLAELSSDHNPIRFYFPRTPKFEIPPPQLNTTWSIFTKTLTNPENFDLPNANST
ncbi:hypothetical protein TNCV_762901 [Trichonephila clavipes]|nr:hypothetical protein TNCV_762901 [Trichonephila clavipes]